MPIGPGKYDQACTVARLATQASGALLIILNGEHGDGFSCQCEPTLVLRLPELLEMVASDIRADLQRGRV